MTLDRQPHLVGDHVVLRPLRPDDFGSLQRIAADSLLWEQHPSKDRVQEEVFREWFDRTLASGGALAILDRRDGQTIGTSRYELHPSDELEIGWTFLARSHWGGTYNGEVKKLMLRHAFAVVDHVIFEVHSANLRSQRAVEKLGAVKIRSQPDAYGRGENFIFRLDAADSPIGNGG